MVSCLFTCTDDLNAEFPAVAARDIGLSAVPLLCAREIDVPGRAAARDPADAALLRRPEHEPRHVYLREAVGLRARPRGRAVSGSSSTAALEQADPGLPGRRDLRLRRRAGEARLATRRPGRRTRRCSRPSRRSCAPSTATPTRPSRALRQRIAERSDLPPAPRRGRQRLLRDPARRRRGAARAGRGDRLRLAVVLDVPAPGGAVGRAGDQGAARRRGLPRPRRDGARGHRRDPHGDRLQPQQPDRHRAAARRRSTPSWPSCRATWP